MNSFKVVVVGGGLAGLLLANGLLHADVYVEVYERLRADARRDGYQIRIAQPSLHSFEMLLDREKNDRIRSKMGHFQDNQRTTPLWYNHRMEFLFDFARFDTQYHGSAPMDRVILRDIILEGPAERGVVQNGKAFSSYEIINPGQVSEKVRVRFDDDSTTDCDLLIGADGSNSKINRAIGLDNLQTIPVLNFITKASLSMAKMRELPDEVRRSPILVSSHRKTYFCVAYLPKDSKDDGSNSFDEQLATFTFSFMVPLEECPEGVRTWDSRDQWALIADLIKDWHPLFRQIIDVIRSEALHVFQPRASERPALTWRSNVANPNIPELGHPRVWLIGDAMHVMLPNRGMGGNQAMFDTTVVLPLIQRLQKIAAESGSVSSLDCATACREYEDEMIPRAFRWVEDSGGFKAVPFDTNTWSGQFFALSLIWTVNLRDAWTYIGSFFRPHSS